MRMTKARSPTLTTSAGRDGDAHVLLNGDKVNRPRASSRSNSASRSTTRRWVAGSRCRAGVDISEGSNKAPGQAGDHRLHSTLMVPTKFRDNFNNIQKNSKRILDPTSKVFTYSSIQVTKYSNIQVFKNSSTQLFKYSSLLVYKFTI